MSIVRKDLKDLTFGRLKVIKRYGTSKHGAVLYECLCSCGNIVIQPYGHLKSGHTKSCGCLQKEIAKKTATTHGLSRNSYYYHLWVRIKCVCYNPQNPRYLYYGGRGIKIHLEWLDNFKEFYDYIIKVLGQRPSLKHSLDRIDVNSDYKPDNIRWATQAEQTQNSRMREKWGKTPSKYKGVYWNKHKWRASIRVKGKNIHLGHFDLQTDAAKAYNIAATKYFKEFAHLNII